VQHVVVPAAGGEESAAQSSESLIESFPVYPMMWGSPLAGEWVLAPDTLSPASGLPTFRRVEAIAIREM